MSLEVLKSSELSIASNFDTYTKSGGILQNKPKLTSGCLRTLQGRL